MFEYINLSGHLEEQIYSPLILKREALTQTAQILRQNSQNNNEYDG